MTRERLLIRVQEVRPGDVMAATGAVVAKVENRKARRRTDRVVRSATAGRVKARTTIVYEDGRRFPRDPDALTVVLR
jgi:hypothetical protein